MSDITPPTSEAEVIPTSAAEGICTVTRKAQFKRNGGGCCINLLVNGTYILSTHLCFTRVTKSTAGLMRLSICFC